MNSPTNNENLSRQDLTDAFLREYQLSCQLSVQASDISEDKLSLHLGKHEFAAVAEQELASLRAGQIRLLSQPAQMIWVLLLRCWGNGTWLVLPFSPFPFPANDEELLLGGQRTEYLDVLQFWNMRSLHALFLRRSWLVDTFTEEELQSAETFFAAMISADEIPAQLLQRTALPITEVTDLRLDYKQKNLAKFAELDAADFIWNELCAELATEPVAEDNFAALMVAEVREKSYLSKELFASLPMAAAGRNESSVCWDCELTARNLLQCLSQGKEVKETRHDVIADDARGFQIQKGEMAKRLWQLPSSCISSKDALFFHREKRILLATGYTVRQGEEGFIVLADWCDDKHETIDAPSQITIFLTMPEEF
jgi:hypothetical protein